MTQLLLFSPAADSVETSVLPISEPAGCPTDRCCSQSSTRTDIEPDSGLHHMGDLARLVLLRYDLVAKRRARNAARRLAK
jgi:hypothetical protein